MELKRYILLIHILPVNARPNGNWVWEKFYGNFSGFQSCSISVCYDRIDKTSFEGVFMGSLLGNCML